MRKSSGDLEGRKFVVTVNLGAQVGRPLFRLAAANALSVSSVIRILLRESLRSHGQEFKALEFDAPKSELAGQ